MISGIPLAEAAAVLPLPLAKLLDGLSECEWLRVEELRLRRGYPMSVLLSDGERPVGGAAGRRFRPAGREQQGSGGRAKKGERRPLARHGLQRERGSCTPRGLSMAGSGPRRRRR